MAINVVSTGKRLLNRALAARSARHREFATLALVAILVTISVALGLHQRGIAVTSTEQVLDCQYVGNGAHTHDMGCYDADGNLVCPLMEREYHVHTDECYTETRELICGLEEFEGHTHTDACYDEEGNLVCELEESEGHQHTDDCYTVTRELTCGKDELTETHTHGLGCFREVVVEEPEANAQPDPEDEPLVVDTGLQDEMPSQTFAQRFEDERGNLVLRVDVEAPEGALPEGATMQVEWIDPAALTQKGQKAVNKAIDNAVNGAVLEQQAVDVTFHDADGQEIEPSRVVTVTLTSGLIDTKDRPVVARLEHLTDKQLRSMQKAIDEGKTVDEAEPKRKAAVLGETGGQSLSDNQLAFRDDQSSTYVLSVTSLRQVLEASDGRTYVVGLDAPAEAGVPADAQLQVAEMPQNTVEYEAYRNSALANMGVDDARDVALSRFFDIKIMGADGQEIQPAAPVQVTIDLADTPKVAEVGVVHFDGATGAPELVGASENAGVTSFEAEQFSVYGVVYTVDFHWNVNGREFEVSVPGGGSISLGALVESLGISATEANGTVDSTDEFVEDVVDVAFSDPSLVWGKQADADTTVGGLKAANAVEVQYSSSLTSEQINEIDAQEVRTGDWVFVSLLPFESEETLTVTMKTGKCLRFA